jgi:hypothetical protein
MYAMNIQNDVIGLVLRENCKSKHKWPPLLHDRADVTVGHNVQVDIIIGRILYCHLWVTGGTVELFRMISQIYS